MSYDIPDKIQYREKIVFGLDWRQLGIAVLFGFLAVLAYRLLPLSGDAKLVAPAVFVCIGAVFVFFKLENPFFDRKAYYSNLRRGGGLDKHVQAFIGVRKVENDTIYLKNGELRAILGVTPINFQNFDDSRKKSAILNYRDFLNQLVHPIQILVRTVNVDLAEYYAHKDQRVVIKNPKLESLFNEFKVWEHAFIKENHVKERLYYIIIPFNPDASIVTKPKQFGQWFKDAVFGVLNSKHKKYPKIQDEAYRKELSDRTLIITQKLFNCGLISRRLENDELISLLMSYFDGYVEVNEEYLPRLVVAKSFFRAKKGEKDA